MFVFHLLFLALFYFSVFATPSHGDPEKGKILFKEKRCYLCHDITLPGTEFKPICPGLRGVSARHDKEWSRKWLKDPAKVWETNDDDVQDIKDRYFKFRGSQPTSRESFMATVIGKQVILSEEEIGHLIDYLWTL